MDAEPGAQEPNLRTDESGLTLTFFLSAQLNPRFRDYDSWRNLLSGLLAILCS
jgi:hypothetical protein